MGAIGGATSAPDPSAWTTTRRERGDANGLTSVTALRLIRDPPALLAGTETLAPWHRMTVQCQCAKPLLAFGPQEDTHAVHSVDLYSVRSELPAQPEDMHVDDSRMGLVCFASRPIETLK